MSRLGFDLFANEVRFLSSIKGKRSSCPAKTIESFLRTGREPLKIQFDLRIVRSNNGVFEKSPRIKPLKGVFLELQGGTVEKAPGRHLMKVLHINNISRVASTLSDALKRRGIQSEVLVFKRGIYGFPYNHLLTGRSFVKVLKAMWKGKNYDIVHWHYPRQKRTIEVYSKFKSVLKHYHGTDLRGKREENFCIVAMPELLNYAPSGLYLPHPINVEETEPIYETGNKRPIVCWYRSTLTRADIIEKALRDLGDRCVSLELKGYKHEEALNFIAKSEIFIDIRTNGWYGLSTAEAMAYGKPVIGYIRQDLAKKYNPPITPYSAHENLTETLKRFVEDSNLRVKMGKACRQHAETVHDVKSAVDMLFPIYEKLEAN